MISKKILDNILGRKIITDKFGVNNKKIIMKCGHEANATHNGKPCCSICALINKGWNIVDKKPINLNNRKCKCLECGKVVPSRKAVAFFEYRPNKPYDLHYDGCRGWD